ncbi:hypothetical protein GCM10027089_41770 [Nocardia thraciensis]
MIEPRIERWFVEKFDWFEEAVEIVELLLADQPRKVGGAPRFGVIHQTTAG